ncbi:glycosyltransferase [Sphingomonas floccifaciens]|uniref:Glycosyltransferase n=1 Tax=Sphingomonas floccifaciens TaxID=1844115 RepID=A0ABW4NDV8_9SPHN
MRREEITDRKEVYDRVGLNRVGIVIIGKNEAKNIKRCLDSVANYKNIVYVDSASSDDSVSIAKEHGVDVIELEASSLLTAARGRNEGAWYFAGNADIDFIQFIDGDCELAPDWIETAVKFLDSDPTVAAVCGRRMERYPAASIYNKLADREWDTAVGQAESTGGESLVRLAAFRECNGFAADQIAHEEPEFCARLRDRNWKIWRLDKLMSVHDAATFRFKEYYRRSRRGGAGMMQAILRRNAKMDKAGATILARAFVWAVFLPVAIVILFVLEWKIATIFMFLYIVQLIRSTWRTAKSGHYSNGEALRVSLLGLSAKFAEADGAMRSLYRFARGRLFESQTKLKEL